MTDCLNRVKLDLSTHTLSPDVSSLTVTNLQDNLTNIHSEHCPLITSPEWYLSSVLRKNYIKAKIETLRREEKTL